MNTEKQQEHHEKVVITINDSKHDTHRGRNAVGHIKHLGNVPKEDVLSECRHHEFHDLGNEGHVEIHGGEVFVSHPPEAPLVEVSNLNTNDFVKFFANWDETLQKVWTTAYAKLKETPKQGDELLCEGGASLMAYLGLTLAALREKKICPHRKYQIRRPTGGA